MARQTIKAVAAMALAATFGCGLAACMQDGARQTATTSVPATSRSGTGLFFVDEGGSAKLAYGLANSDDVDLMLECAKGTGRVQLTQAAGDARTPRLTLSSSGRRADLPTTAETGEGATLLVANTTSDAAPLQSFRRSGQLMVSYADRRVGVNANADERAGVERFFAACERRVG
jgi:hypothetical protein